MRPVVFFVLLSGLLLSMGACVSLGRDGPSWQRLLAIAIGVGFIAWAATEKTK